MPRILIMNAGTPQMSGSDLTSVQVSLAAKSAWRSAWFARQGDVIVSPVAIPVDLLHYIGATLKFDPSSVLVLVPESARTSTVLSDFILEADSIVEQISRHIGQKTDWSTCPCYFTEGAARLARILGVSLAGSDFALQRGPDLLNRKSHFRQLAASAALPMPSGWVATTSDELFRAVNSLRVETGSVIVKLDNGAGGVGNVVITGMETGPVPGARETRKIDWSSFDPEALWSEMTTASCRTVVVEAYHPASSMFYLEFEIEEKGSIAYINSGNIRLRRSEDRSERALVWTGLELPADLTITDYSNAYGHAYRFVELARALGYRGLINIDAIFTPDGQLLFNEANGRWGGGSVLHSIAVRLLGPHYAHSHVISSVRDVRLSSLRSALDCLAKEGLLFDNPHGEGVIPLAVDQDAGTVECAIIARDRLTNRRLEDQLLRIR
ncbi:peptide ligase PGM1-related protein [Bradyrhizobium sp. ARR65]|uniref:preATP grasp domain-containing protein n=1 Tax=Bradyrhizobium sp. ARR65 TaxID=1040989 RepID=UPI0004658D79|nr:peptide ligase PGM1-related protein [Bradyrhizobium sp. ARR65]